MSTIAGGRGQKERKVDIAIQKRARKWIVIVTVNMVIKITVLVGSRPFPLPPEGSNSPCPGSA